MSWNIVPECSSVVILCIIWTYSRKGNLIPDARNRIFQASFFVTFSAMVTNILSTLMITYLTPAMLVPAWIVTLAYYIMTPLMGLVYFYYNLTYMYEDRRVMSRIAMVASVPAAFYMGTVLSNPWTKTLFDLSLEDGYVQGPLRPITYVIFYFYCVCCIVAVLVKWKKLTRSVKRTLISFPLIAALVIVIQLMMPDLILSGTAATCALLIIYLNLQNKQITMDYLTGQPNRMQFLQMLEMRLEPGINGLRPFVIIVFSLREFKAINDLYGQYNGDAFLVEVARYLKNNIPGRPEIYRYSGDEFAFFLDDVQRDGVDTVLNILLRRMEHPWYTENCTATLMAAIGIVTYPRSSEHKEELINGIEFAVKVAKEMHQQEKIYFCDSVSLERVRRQQKIGSILQETVEKNLFTLHYQPILDVESGRFSMGEALMRIEESSIGRISPGEFIPVAEKSGLIVEITYRVLEKACRCIRRLREEQIPTRGISVNFSAQQFAQRDLVERVKTIIERNEVPFSCIKIEITESTLAENLEAVSDFVTQMHALGVQIELDDFGTGFSNLSSVTNLAIDIIKLDRSLICSAMSNKKSASIVQNLARTFRELEMVVLAEGVETEEQSEFVVNSGCRLIQGFLYAKPMPEENFIRFLKEHWK